MSGFYRKDLIAESFVNINQRLLFILIFLLGVTLTACYSVKLIKNLITPLDQNVACLVSLGGFNMIVGGPLMILGVISVISGSLLSGILDLNFNLFLRLDKLLPLFFIAIGVVVGSIFSSLCVRASSIFYLVPSSQIISGSLERSNILVVDNGLFSSFCSGFIFHAMSTSRSLLGLSFIIVFFYLFI